MLKVYIDMSALNRIFDDQSQSRIYFESSAMIVIYSLLEEGKLELCSSVIHEYENGKNPFLNKKAFIENVLRISKWFCEADEKVLKIAERLECEGIKAYDALHLACAEALDAEFFITCDDKLIKRYRGSMRVADPVNFVHETIYGG
ncbi:MAG: hypothetical protein BWY32_03219 [bacterium ADurb.Bin243]|nr:MAG: hypothetical protein BWY32_03219 [bacterium ADurb.Bin243]HOD42513.1 PIN domain-containing protein [Candidatus Wallbacteria bacterium]